MLFLETDGNGKHRNFLRLIYNVDDASLSKRCGSILYEPRDDEFMSRTELYLQNVPTPLGLRTWKIGTIFETERSEFS